MGLEIKGSFAEAIALIKRAQQRVKPMGADWATTQATAMDQRVRSHLDTQGRGGAAPPLSDMTRHIYSVDGEPDGSGIVNHLTLEFRQSGDRFIAVLGIPDGKPSMIAKVQDRGATIPVSDRMRGFLSAAYGIHLRKETTHINIPGRHFWEDSLRVVKRKGKKDLRKLIRLIFV